MNITIDYDGSTAICKINGKPVNKAAVLEVTQAFSAFRIIENAYKRENCSELKESENKQKFKQNTEHLGKTFLDAYLYLSKLREEQKEKIKQNTK